MQHLKIRIGAFIASLVIIEISAYFYIKQQIETSVSNEVRQHYVSIDKEINTLMEYKERITTGKLGGYGPDDSPMNLDWFKGQNWTLYPDSTYFLAWRKHFIYSFSENKTFEFENNHDYNVIKKLEFLYPIYLPTDVWEIKQLHKVANSLYVQSISPHAWGYKRCNSYERQFRPTGYIACKEAFDYLIKENTEIAEVFTEEFSKINTILNLSNKYFYINRIDKGETETTKENTYTFYSQFGYIQNHYYIVFYEKEFPEVEYRISPKKYLIEKEIFNRTLNTFIIITIPILLILILLYRYINRNNHEK